MNKQTLAITVTIITTLCVAMWFSQNKTTDIPKQQSNLQDKIPVKPSEKTTITATAQARNQTLSSAGMERSDSNLENQTETVLEEDTPPAISSDFVKTDGTLNFDKAGEKLLIEQFEQYLLELTVYDSTDEISLAKQQQLAKKLGEIEELHNYRYELGCGKGICGVVIKDAVESKTLLTKIFQQTADLGLAIHQSATNAYGEKEIRMIFNQDDSAKGKSMTISLIPEEQ